MKNERDANIAMAYTAESAAVAMAKLANFSKPTPSRSRPGFWARVKRFLKG